ncbi:COR domain-containing protein [Candidatus Electronema sp. JM]|uniref:COR domain-containing protein n=1 Tax=Candidatus Electronema sp. JM TaxID=3401571 RepID=UPI003AA9A804
MTNKELLKVIEEAKASGATELYLRGNQLTALPPELFRLKNLTRLDLRDNQLTTLPPEIGQLRNLQKLALWNNKLTALPSEICQLKNLTELSLFGNQLTALPSELFQLTNLTGLDLYGNKLTTLPPEICQLPKLEYLLLDLNPLTSPPYEIAIKGIDAIREYFANLQAGESALNEIKVLLVGDGAAGKTSLVKQLLGEAFDKDEDTTHGISIRGWDVEAGGQPIKVNLWDFGGQEIMHATHQFFLSKRSLYVLVLDGRKDERPEYWLQHIESFGGDSPVLVVLNKQDSNPSFDINRPFLQGKYKGIRGFFRTSCKSGAGIAQFKESLFTELAQVPMIGIRWPKTWFAVKQRIEQMSTPYISREDYGELCADAGIAGDENRETLVDFLHDLGVAVHFKDFILKAMHVLDPVWVTNAVYKIITAEKMSDSKGVLHADCLDGILKQQDGEKHCYPAHTHVYLLELMKKFELCYPVESQAVLIPQLLPVPEPKFTFEYKNALGFVLHYHSFLPPSVMPRFLVKRHKQIKAGLCWRTGAVLHDQASGTEAVIKADTEARRIYLWVNGPRRKEFLSFLWFTLREINNSFEKLAVSERIPMPDDPACSADYQTLVKYAQRGNDMYIPDGSDKEYSVRQLLGTIEPDREDQLLELLRMIKAQQDEKESGSEAFNSLFELKPSVFGVSFNLSEAFKRILATQRGK